jgi:hypothetical protein
MGFLCPSEKSWGILYSRGTCHFSQNVESSCETLKIFETNLMRYPHPTLRSYTVTYMGCDYRRGMDWWIDLLTTCIHRSEILFTDHWHTQCPQSISVSTSRFLATVYNTVEILQFPTLMSFFHSPRAAVFSTDNSTDWVPGWRPFHTNLLVFS